MKTIGSVISTFVLLSMLLDSCKKETGTPDPADANLTNPAKTVTPLTLQSASTQSDISPNSAKITSTITASGSSSISEHGHYYSKTNKAPGASDEKTKLGIKTGPFPTQFSSQLANLEESTTYYVKPYATNPQGTTTGEILQLTTNGFGAWNKTINYPETGESVPADYDGDGKTDIAVIIDGVDDDYLQIDYAGNGFAQWDKTVRLLNTTKVIVPADYDGDGKDDLGIHWTTGAWTIYYAKDGFVSKTELASGYGKLGGEAVADYDGDGKADIAFFKDSQWFIDYANDGFGSWNRADLKGYGALGHPVPADYDGDGKADIALHTDNRWYIDYAADGFGSWNRADLVNYGSLGGEAVADYDGDGKADIGLRKDGNWYIDYAANGFGQWNKIYAGYGTQGKPVPADYDGDGKADLGLHNAKQWFIDYWNNQ